MVCTNICSFLLAFNKNSFNFLTGDQYWTELQSAANRAYYIMTASCTASFPGWGISAEDMTTDPSGQLQIALELLTGAEFLKRKLGLYEKTGLVGSYKSPTGESITLSAQDLAVWDNLEKRLRNEAWETAYPAIPDCAKTETELIVSNYDWEILEKEYNERIYPVYTPKPYINASYWGGYSRLDQ